MDPNANDAERSRRIKRSAVVLGLVAFAVYAAFILTSVLGLRQ